ncbi:MAG: hypothetical protein WCE46_10015 [Methanoregula sp.]|jgi:hypothetical protein|uniref:hypothetical protein n=1 Tax=Methanoregula sp. TaxID=2052170 RepID=UPI003C7664A7
MMHGKHFLPGMLVVLVLLSAGCTVSRPDGNTTVVPTEIIPVITLLPAPAPVGGTIVAVPVQLPVTISPPTPTPSPVATQTVDKHPLPTISSIHIYSNNFHIEPLSYDQTGTVTTGNVDIYGTLESTTSYPVWVDMRVDMYGAYSPDKPKATAYDTVRMFPYGTSSFDFRINNYVFNDRLDYTTTFDTYNLTILKVTVIPT